MKQILCVQKFENKLRQQTNLFSSKDASVKFIQTTSELRKQLILQGYDLLVFVDYRNAVESTDLEIVRNLFPLKILDMSLDHLNEKFSQLVTSSLEEDFQIELNSVLSRFRVLGESLEKKSVVEFSQMFPARIEKYIETVHAAILKKKHKRAFISNAYS